LKLIPGASAYLVMAAVVAIDFVLLYRFFHGKRVARMSADAESVA
jgi:hypothetical protein